MRAIGYSIGSAVLLFLYAGCSSSAGGCSVTRPQADFDLKLVPGVLKFQSERGWASQIVDGRYRLLNNVWNSRAIAGPYRQQVFVKEQDGKTAFGWVWSWQDGKAPATYPEIQAGHSPWNGEVVAGSGFPFQVGSKKLVANYDITLSASGAHNVAMEFWVVSALPPARNAITHEVVILLAHQGTPIRGERITQAKLVGNTFDVYVHRNHGDATGASTSTWTQITFVAETPMLRGPLDVGQLIDFLLKSGQLSPQSHIANLELGSNIMHGSGSALIRDFAITIE